MNRRVVLLCAAVSFFYGCNAEKTPSSNEVPVEVTDTNPGASDVGAENKSYYERFLAGETLNIRMDSCDPALDSASWDGDADPLYRLICGEVYKIRFDKETNMVNAEGLLESTEGKPAILYNHSREWSGRENFFNIWGAKFYFNQNGEVFDEKEVLSGRFIN